MLSALTLVVLTALVASSIRVRKGYLLVQTQTCCSCLLLMQPFTSTYRKSCHSLQHSWNSAYGTGDTGCSLMVWHSLSMIYIDVPLWCDTVSRSIIYRQGKLSISCLHRQWKHPWSSKKNLEALLCKIYEAISFHSLVEYLHLRIQSSNCSQCSEYIHLQSLRPTYLQLIHNAPILQSKNGCMHG